MLSRPARTRDGRVATSEVWRQLVCVRSDPSALMPLAERFAAYSRFVCDAAVERPEVLLG